MVYLDSAATTLQKPPSVSAAMRDALRTCASPGRGGYEAAERAARMVYQCRSDVAKLIGIENMENIVFTLNATHALNIAIKSLVFPGSRVVVSGYEHNAVTRPLTAIGNVKMVVAQSPLFDKYQCIKAFENAITRDTSAVVCNQISNVFGFIQPIAEIAQLCQNRGVPLIVDASQSAGIVPINVDEWGAAFVAMPGHKSLYGPQGTGVLACNSATKTLIEGGTGSMSLLPDMPDFLPDRLEAGTHNVPGIAGLDEGVRFVERYGVARIACYEKALVSRAAKVMRMIRGVEVFASPDGENQSGVLSFRVAGMDCETVASVLASKQIAVRAGFHCAPLAHRTAGTIDSGTVRISTSAFNKREEIEYFLDVLEEISSRNAG